MKRSGARTRRRPRGRRVRKPAFEDLPDKVLLRVLQELPQPDLLQVARVSSRLQDICQDSSLWRHLQLGPEVATDRACNLLRNAPHLVTLRLHHRHDADAILLETSRYCRQLEILELTQCRGSVSFKGLAYVPMLKLAQNCQRLRRIAFKDTDFLCSRVFKVWVETRGPDDPSLQVAVNSVSRRQANYLTTVLHGPEELHRHANLGTPVVLLVHNHTLSLHVLEQVAEVALAGPSVVAEEAIEQPCCSARVRPAPSSSSSVGEPSGLPSAKRPRTQPVPAESSQHSLRAVFVRSPSASTSTGLRGRGRVTVLDVDSSDDSDVGCEDDNLDVVAGTPAPTVTLADSSSHVVQEERSTKAVEYKSVFTLGCIAEPVANSWFRSGYMPSFTNTADNSEGEQSEQDEARRAGRSLLLPLPPVDTDSDDEKDKHSAVLVMEDDDVLATPLKACDSLPLSAVRLAASLKVKSVQEPEDQPCGDLLVEPVPDLGPATKSSSPHLNRAASSVGDHLQEADGSAGTASTPPPPQPRSKSDRKPGLQRH